MPILMDRAGIPVVAAALGNPPAPANPLGLFVATIRADARGPGHAGFAERVVVRLVAQAGRRPYDILALERIAPGSTDAPNA